MPPKKKAIKKASADEKRIHEELLSYVIAVEKETKRAFENNPPTYTLAVSPERMPVLLDILQRPEKYT